MSDEPLAGFDGRRGALGRKGGVGTRFIISKRLKIIGARQKSSQLAIDAEVIPG
jgi:hypothetical protein